MVGVFYCWSRDNAKGRTDKPIDLSRASQDQTEYNQEKSFRGIKRPQFSNTRRIYMSKFIARFLVSLITGLVMGIIGMLAAAWFGGNFATGFVFNGVQGYEATSQIGFIVFSLLGLFVGWQFMTKRQRTGR